MTESADSRVETNLSGSPMPNANPLHAKKASLTDVEMAFLSALLIDQKPPNPSHDSSTERTEISSKIQHPDQTEKQLNDEILFSVPKQLAESAPKTTNAIRHKRQPSIKKDPEDYRFLVGLWQAHEDGVSPQVLSNLRRCSDGPIAALSSEAKLNIPKVEVEEVDDDDKCSIRSDQEVRADPDDDNTSDASWNEDEIQHFDAWQVLKDEYAKDFGFDFSPDGMLPGDDEDELEPNTFQILGTSSEDESAHPHVLSPPLMDSLLNFVPEHLKGQNLWMKYSLVRDGASLDTFKQYAKASKHTVLAIETTKGQVFGCYASSPWRTNPSLFGGAPSFVFRMRHGRGTECHSLLEQAQMEGEIDVHFLLQDGQHPQACTHNMLGVGEGTVRHYGPEGELRESEQDMELMYGKNYGFAIALADDLLSGTTSQCSSYKNPCLVDTQVRGDAFDVLNLELWTFTPCFSLDSAEKLEMTQYFVDESIRNSSMRSTASSSSSTFSSRDLSQVQFYRRLGHDDSHEELRDQWQYRNMMEGRFGERRGVGNTPRFQNS